MSRLLLYASPPGTGKTALCVDLFRAEVRRAGSGIDSRAYFVLPSREHAERIQSLILKQGVPGLFNAHVLTVNELLSRLVGASPANRPGDALRLALVRQALSDACQASEAPAFEAAAAQGGLARALSDTCKEMTASRMSAAELRRRAVGLRTDPALEIKYRSLLAVLERYRGLLRRLGLREPEDDVESLFAGEPNQRQDLVIFDGFYHFTRAQLRLLEAVCRSSEKVVVTLTLDPAGSGREDVFSYPRATRDHLVGMGFQEARPQRRSACRTREKSLIALSERLFAARAPSAVSPTAIKVLSAPGPIEEIRSIAREIARLYRTQSYHYSDFCLIFRQLGPYDSLLGSVFAEYGIPLHVHERRRLIDNGLLRTVYDLLGVYLEGWPAETTASLLGTSYLRASLDWRQLRDLRSEMVAADRAVWVAAALKIGGGAAQTLARLAALEDALRSCSDAQSFGSLLLDLAKSLDTGADARDQEALRSFRSLLNGWRRYYSGSGGREFDPGKHLTELRGAIESGLYSTPPADRDRVQAYDVVMALPKEYKVVFVAGLLDKAFPREITEDPVISDQERGVLNGADPLLEMRAHRVSGEKYFYYMAVTRARERLYLTYPSHGEDGRPSAVSAFVRLTQACFAPEIAHESFGFGERPDPDRCEVAGELRRSLAAGLFEAATPVEPRSVPLIDRTLARSGASALRDAYRPPEAALRDPRSLAHAAGRQGPYSASFLETYATCAFKGHCDKSLRLREHEDKAAAKIGSVAHDALERYFKSESAELLRGGAYLRDPGRLIAALDAELERALAKSDLPGWEPYRYRTTVKQLRQLLRRFVVLERDHAKPGYTPHRFELPFGRPESDSLPPLEIRQGSESVLLHGYVDRVDLEEGGLGALVLDYKSGKRPIGLAARLRIDLEYQLPIYLWVARDLLGRRPFDAQLRILRQVQMESVREVLEKAKEDDLPHTLEEVMDRLPARILALVRRLKGGDIRVRSKSCKYCAYDTVCRFEKWKLAYDDDSEE